MNVRHGPMPRDAQRTRPNCQQSGGRRLVWKCSGNVATIVRCPSCSGRDPQGAPMVDAQAAA